MLLGNLVQKANDVFFVNAKRMVAKYDYGARIPLNEHVRPGWFVLLMLFEFDNPRLNNIFNGPASKYL